MLSGSALKVAQTEIDRKIDRPERWVAALSSGKSLMAKIELHPDEDVGATIASGSYPTAGMMVIPCSGGTLGAIANGISRGLLQRAADVCLKERRPLVLAFRESPYSLVHVENMRKATLAGAIVAPPTPAFYISEPSMERFLDVYCSRAARWFGLEIPGRDDRWGGTPKRAPSPGGRGRGLIE